MHRSSPHTARLVVSSLLHPPPPAPSSSSCANYRLPCSRPTIQKRYFGDQMTFRTQHGSIKVNLKAKDTVGVSQSRGERPYQEDAYCVTSLLIPTPALKRNLVKVKGPALGWSPETLEGYPGEGDSLHSAVDPGGGAGGNVGANALLEGKRQVAFFGVYDGHGGNEVSTYLKNTLPDLIEKAEVGDIPKVIKQYRALGGYLRRYRGGPLERFREAAEKDEEGELDRLGMGLDEMCVLAFLQADISVLSNPLILNTGSVGTLCLLHSLSLPHSLPYFTSPLLSLTIAHLGDTRALLASATSGRVQALTENHHPDSRVESERLRQSGTGIVTDSFGESRWGGTLANTRGVGDREWKGRGVIAEPEVSSRVLRGEDWAFLVLLSDGITDSMSDQEVIDLVRGCADPTRAAGKIVKFAEDVGATDNMTAIVVPLPGWGKSGGVDTSASLREFRLRQTSSQSGRQKRM